MNASAALARAAEAVAAGGVIAYPTEAVFGLGCDPARPEAVRRVIDLKGRSAEKGLILVAADRAQLAPYLRPPSPELEARLAASWPGPVTWILRASPRASELLTGGSGRIAVRISAFEPLRRLCRRCGCALVSTSANPAGQPPARTADQVMAYFPTGIDWVVAGPTGGAAQPSRIYDGDSLQRLR